MGQRITTSRLGDEVPGKDRTRIRPWLVYVDGQRLNDTRGVGRSFASESAAVSAGRRVVDKRGKGR